MTDPYTPPPKPETFSFSRFASTFKFLFIGVIILILLIPVAMVEGIIRERQARSEQVQQSIAQNWGQIQTVIGPMVVVPYRVIESVSTNNGPATYRTRLAYAHFLPDKLATEGKLDPDLRYRGIYNTTVYASKLQLRSQFPAITAAQVKALNKSVSDKDILWSDARVLLVISDIKGLQTQASVLLDGKTKKLLEPAEGTSGLQSSLGQAFPKPFSLAVDLNLNGSRQFQIAPLGKDTQVSLRSSWQDPSFIGAYLPTKRSVGAKGFEASWQTAYFSRAYPQAWSDDRPLQKPHSESMYTPEHKDYTPPNESASGASAGNAVQGSVFGVSLITPVDFYQQSERAVKYSILFILLTFLTYFLFEVVVKAKVHAIQYTIVGLALCLFYLLLLSLSEVIGFFWAYWIGSALIISLVSFYTASITKGRKRLGIIMPCVLTALYGYLYILLQLEDYSLLFGTLGLFIALAVVMVATRNVDWYNPGQSE